MLTIRIPKRSHSPEPDGDDAICRAMLFSADDRGPPPKTPFSPCLKVVSEPRWDLWCFWRAGNQATKKRPWGLASPET